MNILHTADWHIGAELNGISLEPDFILFRDWLVHTCIPQTQAEVLIVSGDIFDKANPSTSAREVYYETLGLLLTTSLKQVVITGGNHDNASNLDGPADLLKRLKISITGGLPDNLDDLFHPIPAINPEVLILSMPYLKDRDVRTGLAGESSASREESVRNGIQQLFHRVGEQALPFKQQGIPVIVMGHLFASGVKTSDSERSIQVGNLGGVDASAFPEAYFDYVALGHIHRPQCVGNSERIRYSGSPIALSYSEREQQKIVILIQTEGGKISTRDIEVPEFRKLIRIQGSYKEAQQKISSLTHDRPLPALIEVRVEEPHYDPGLLRDMTAWIELTGQERKDFQITRHQFQVVSPDSISETKPTEVKRLEEFKPEEVFEALLDERQVAEDSRQRLRESFVQLLQEVQEAQL
jgi:exonuclease SbcD